MSTEPLEEEVQHYLLDYLEEEFSRVSDIRVRIQPLPKQSGVSVRTETREYFFPFHWVREKSFDKIQKLVTEIKDRHC